MEIPENATTREQRGNAIMDKIIKSVPHGNDKYYIEDYRDTNNFKIKGDPEKQEKDVLYRIFFAVEKKITRSINKK